MLKKLYKIRRDAKVFYMPSVQWRALAYGQKILDEVLLWRRFHDIKQKGEAAMCLSAQGDVTGETVFASVSPTSGGRRDRPAPCAAGTLPCLVFEGNRYEVRDGRVIWNGNPTRLYLGTELKAWALMVLPYGISSEVTPTARSVGAIIAVGKPADREDTMLTCYRVNRGEPTDIVLGTQVLETVLGSTEFLTVFGRHIFLVHNTMLRYFYFHTEDHAEADASDEAGELQPVPISGNTDPASVAWGRYIGPSVVLTTTGWVFWSVEGQVYGFRIGYPAQLTQLRIEPHEQLLGITTEQGALLMHLQDRNTGQRLVRRQETDGEVV